MPHVDCYACKHSGPIPSDTHRACNHPDAGGPEHFLTPLRLVTGEESPPAMKRMGVTLDPRGVAHGWAWWPLNFDPVWVRTCNCFEAREKR